MIAAIVITVVLLIFIIQNSERASVHFLFWTLDMRVWVALSGAAILGFAAGYLIARSNRKG